MKNGKLRLGFIGCGGIAVTKYFPILRKLVEICELAAFCDLDLVRAEAGCKEYGVDDARVFVDYRDMLNLADLDLIYVLTPNCFHAEMTEAAFDAGKHVVCEKPMASTAAEGERMIAAAERASKKLMVSYQSRFREDARLVKAACVSGDLGEIYYARAHAKRRREVPTWGVFTNRALQGGGPLIDIGSHALDLTLWLIGNFEAASVVGTVYYKMADAVDGNRFGPWDTENFQVEDAAFGFIKMKNGATVYLETSWALNTTDVREAMSSLCGDKGGAEMYRQPDGQPGLIFTTARHGHLLNVTPQDLNLNAPFGQKPETAAERECRLTLQAILRDEPVPVDPYEALQVTRVLEAIYLSATENRLISL